MKANKKIKNNPDIIMIEVLGDKSVSLKWEKATGADKYVVQRSLKPDADFKKIAVVQREADTYVDQTIEDEGLYWYRIVAQRVEGDEKPIKRACDPQSINITSIEAPILKEISSDLKNGINFSWECSDEVDEFLILRRHSFMKKPIAIDTVDGTQFTYNDVKSVHGPLYYYSIQGVIEDDGNLRYTLLSNELPTVNLDKTVFTKIKRKLGKKVIFSVRLTSGAEGYALFKSSEEDGEYKCVFETQAIDSLDLFDKGERKEKGAYYKLACIKNIDGEKFYGPKTDAVFVKYR